MSIPVFTPAADDWSLLTALDHSPGPRIDDDALHDLALDQLVERVGYAVGAELAAVLTTPLTDPADIRRRQDVFRALDAPGVRTAVKTLIAAVESCDASLASANKSYSSVEADLWRLHAAVTYLDAFTTFADELPGALSRSGIDSEALSTVASVCSHRAAEPAFRAVRAEARELSSALDDVVVALWLRGATATVAQFDDEPDDVATIRDVFARFEGHGAPRRRVDTSHPPRTSGRRMDGVQAQILTMTERLHPDLFGRISAFAPTAVHVVDEFARRFVHDARLYLAYLDVLEPLRSAGLRVCYPTVSARARGIDAQETYDLVLASRLSSEGRKLVTNDLRLDETERLLVVTGPNQGGKTTFARTIGQLHHLAAVGLPVPGRRVELALADRVLTHFERPERLDNLAGRLGEGLQRMKDLLERSTDRSVLVLNEVFTSTALDDARFLTQEVLARARKIGALVVCVTFIDDIASFDDATVSMVADVDPADPAARTFRLTRRPADGMAYAKALAERHGLTAQAITARLEALS